MSGPNIYYIFISPTQAYNYYTNIDIIIKKIIAKSVACAKKIEVVDERNLGLRMLNFPK